MEYFDHRLSEGKWASNPFATGIGPVPLLQTYSYFLTQMLAYKLTSLIYLLISIFDLVLPMMTFLRVRQHERKGVVLIHVKDQTARPQIPVDNEALTKHARNVQVCHIYVRSV